jgi:hypothetical protein
VFLRVTPRSLVHSRLGFSGPLAGHRDSARFNMQNNGG